MKRYYYYSRYDSKKEPISRMYASGRLAAAERFAIVKGLDLKTFLSIYSISK